MAFHQTIIHGRIGKDIECNYSASGVAVARFPVAVSEKFKGEEKTTWYNVTAFKTTAENLAKFFSKGSEIIIVGNMEFGSYEKDGRTVYTSNLIVRMFDFCGPKQQGQQANSNQQGQGFQSSNQGFQNQQPQQNQQQPQQQFQQNNNAGFQNQEGDGLPF